MLDRSPVASEATKTCTQCADTKPETAFPLKDRKSRRSICNECYNERRRATGVHVRRGPRETPEERRARMLQSTYKLSPKQYSALLDSQSGACAMCRALPKQGKRLVVDHCHTTGVVRALLCTYCNVVVGIHENHRQAAAEYLAVYGNGNPLLVAQGGAR